MHKENLTQVTTKEIPNKMKNLFQKDKLKISMEILSISINDKLMHVYHNVTYTLHMNEFNLKIKAFISQSLIQKTTSMTPVLKMMIHNHSLRKWISLEHTIIHRGINTITHL